MLQIQNVRKTYKTKAGEVNALDGISLTFPETGLVFITGKSGCGKTTLLNVIGGLDGIDEGEILIQDKKFSEFSASEYDSYRNTFIGFIFQEYNLLPEYTVEKNIKMAMELQGRNADDEEFQKLLEDVEIKGLKNRKPSELSGGQRQRVAIARALVKHPRIIMADEPTGALDLGTGIQVLETLKKLSEKTLVIVVSHDREFAEKYADRIVHLEDGKVMQDVTFTEKEIKENVSEQGNKVVVRDGSELSEREKDVLAKAVKERKNIEIIEKPRFRDKQPTGHVSHCVDKPVTLCKSRMKLRSAAHLGLKSLFVKPVRLVLTVLISALAFAMFGVCDTIANFSTYKVLKNQVKIAPSQTAVTTIDYIVDQEAEDSYFVKVSEEAITQIQNETGGVVKGIFDWQENRAGLIDETFAIAEVSSSAVSSGRKYYTKTINGFIEFDNREEISEDGSFMDFGYKLVYGRYPDPVYQNGVVNTESLHEVAISNYLAESIIHYLNGKQLNQKTIAYPKDLLGVNISVDQHQYEIVGIIDCGKIPTKYDTLSHQILYTKEHTPLINDFDGYIDSTAQKCLFVAKDFLTAIRKENNATDIYYAGNDSWTFFVGSDRTGAQAATYLYNAQDYDENNILLFNGEYSQDGKIQLADDEVLIHPLNLEKLFATKLYNLPSISDRAEVKKMISDLDLGTAESNRATLAQILDVLKINLEHENFNATIRQRSLKTNETKDTNVKIVGVYFGIDTESYTISSRYKLMMNTNLMDQLGVYSQQGNYSKLLFSAGSVRKGAGVIADYLISNNGLAMTWYNNSVLEMIRTNETTIRQGAKLFLYADLALSVFAIFMLYNYISTSIASKRQSVGILRALGAGGKDILRTFLSESLIVSVINGILANLFALLGCTLVNAYIVKVMNISVHFALFGIRQIAVIAGISLLTAVVASLLPIIKISKKKPVELIRRS